MSDYLWDRQGEAERDVAYLEAVLGHLRYRPVDVDVPFPAEREANRSRYVLGAVLLAVAAAITLVFLLQPEPETRPAPAPVVAPPHEQPEVEPPLVKPPVIEPPPTPADGPDDPPDHEEELRRALKHVDSLGRPKDGERKARARARSRDARETADAIEDVLESLGEPPPASPERTNDPHLPEKLGAADVRAGIAPIQAEARACGQTFGAEPGTKVNVKISIEGATGRVTSSTALPPHQGTDLGNCVAKVFAKAKFRRFRRHQMGVQAPIRM
jgi:hypothetical protein